MSRKNKESIKVIHRAPGKKGKLEYRRFESLEKAAAYLERNRERMAR